MQRLHKKPKPYEIEYKTLIEAKQLRKTETILTIQKSIISNQNTAKPTTKRNNLQYSKTNHYK